MGAVATGQATSFASARIQSAIPEANLNLPITRNQSVNFIDDVAVSSVTKAITGIVAELIPNPIVVAHSYDHAALSASQYSGGVVSYSQAKGGYASYESEAAAVAAAWAEVAAGYWNY